MVARLFASRAGQVNRVWPSQGLDLRHGLAEIAGQRLMEHALQRSVDGRPT
jgi:hypothetical protein